MKRDSGHSSAFICVILVQNETETERSHFTGHFGGILVEAGPCVGRYFPGMPPHPGGSSRLSHSAGQETRLSPGEATLCQRRSQAQLIHLQVISTGSKGSDTSFLPKSTAEHPPAAAASMWEREGMWGAPSRAPTPHRARHYLTVAPCPGVPIHPPHPHTPFAARDRGVC